MPGLSVQPVILAGGRGTRLARVLPHLPKPMASAAGRPFVEWIVRSLARGGFRRVLLSTGHLGHVIEAHFDNDPVPGVEVRCIRETQPLGTAGALLHVIDQSPWKADAWLVLNGDSLAFVDWSDYLGRLDRSEVDGLIVGCWVDDTSRFGRLRADADGRLEALEEKPASPREAGLINSGIYLLRDRLLSDNPSQRPLSLERELFRHWLREGRHLDVYAVKTDFLDIGTEATLPEADLFIRRHEDRF